MLRLSLFALACILFSGNVLAHFSIDKVRLYFDRSNRFQTLTLRNNSDEPINYSIKINHVQMTEDGRLTGIAEDKAFRSAKSLLRYSPRRGTVLPGGSQILRFTVRKPKGLEEGEYRSQLRIEGGLANDPNMLTAKLAYNLPIIVRHGKPKAKADLELIGLNQNDKGEPALFVNILRQGNRSLFGNFVITNAEGTVIGETKGMSVYEPLQKRMARIDLNGLITSEITVRYEELTEYGGDNKVKKVFNLR